jgi:hypothetical protein
LFAQVKHRNEHRAHHQNADREQQKHAGEFAGEIFKTRDRFREDGVKRAVFDVLWNQPSRRDDCEQRSKDAHRA